MLLFSTGMRNFAVCFAFMAFLLASAFGAPCEHSDVQQAYLDVPWDYRSSSGPVLRLPYGVAQGPKSDPKVAFVIISDEHQFYADTFFSQTMTDRHDALTYYLNPRGFHASSMTEPEYREFLTVDHALRDIDKFVKEIVNPSGSLRVVMVGNGYGARLAGWYHQESMGKTVGAVLDSPQTRSTAESFHAYEYATKVLPKDCLDGLSNVTATLAEKLREGDMTALRQKLGLCSNPDVSSERLTAFFWHTLMFPIVRAVGHTYNSFTKPKATLANVCARLTVGQDRVWDYFSTLLKETRENSQTCVRVDYADWVRVGGSNDEVVTLAQQCLELAAFPVSSYKSLSWMPESTTVTVDFFDDLCQSFMGPKYSVAHAVRNQEALKRRFGSDPYLGRNAFIIKSQGDPFLHLVPQTVTGSSSISINYPGYRGETFARESASDSSALKELRFKLGKFLDALLG
jgi:pimeloyl-ACP methyl ester carboxylesterase